MKRKPAHSDDVLFISALAAVLLGVGLLLFTTGVFKQAERIWPILVMAVGGVLLYFALVRGASSYIFYGGTLFMLTGVLAIVANIAGWSFVQAWPLEMVVAGITGLCTGLRRHHRLRAAYGTTSIGFLVLGAAFSLFSFRVLEISLPRFVASWWPSLLIVAGLSLFFAYGYMRKIEAKNGSNVARKPPKKPDDGRQAGP